MSTNLERLRDLLRTLFRFEQAELDFGVYRILARKRAEVERFLDEELGPRVAAAFETYRPADVATLQRELAQAVDHARRLGVDAGEAPAVRALRERLATSADVRALEEEVFSLLRDFFGRYYEAGAFVSSRRSRGGAPAAAREGEEVRLHWADHDRYYVKTADHLSHYAFSTGARRVRFVLAGAVADRDNNKSAPGSERRFMLSEAADAVTVDADELVVKFVLRPDPEGRAQDELNGRSGRIIRARTPPAWADALGAPAPTRARPGRTVLDSHLERYTARDTFDYFIHKDLGGFLRRELDAFVKDELLRHDDGSGGDDGGGGRDAARERAQLDKIHVVRGVARDIIAFLAQFEDIQRRLWLEKKLVRETSWCATLDHVPDELLSEVAANDAQREEWVRLFGIDAWDGGADGGGDDDEEGTGYTVPLRPAFLRAHPSLVLDTRHFPASFTERLVASFAPLDDRVDGVLIHGENFQALSLLEARYRGAIKCVYIDPPYNTDASRIIYKNGYRRSAWAALLADRLALDARLRASPSMRCVAIDDVQLADLRGVLETLGDETHLATAAVRSKPQGRPTASGFSANHEYAVFWGSPAATIGRLPRRGSKANRYPHRDEGGVYAWSNLRKSGADSDRRDRPRSFYPVYVAGDALRVPNLRWDAASGAWRALEAARPDEETVLPIDPAGNEKVWTCAAARARAEIADIRVVRGGDGRVELQKKYRPDQRGALPGTWWDRPAYSASESGTKVLKNLFGEKVFDYPKSVPLVEDCLRICGLADGDVVLDYFAGSGTTGHATIALNRDDGGRRRFVLVEMGDYFDTVLVPRLKRVAYASAWKDGRPETPAGSSHLFQCLRLASYDDVLASLARPERTGERSDTVSSGPEPRREHALAYVLDVAADEGRSLLDLPLLSDPFRCTLAVSGGDGLRSEAVDLVASLNYLLGLRVERIGPRFRRTADFGRDGDGRLRLVGGRTSPAEGGVAEARDLRASGDVWTFRVVRGRSPDGEHVVVVWRTLTGAPERDELVLTDVFRRVCEDGGDARVDVVYVNGDADLERARRPGETWTVRRIEDAFRRLRYDASPR